MKKILIDDVEHDLMADESSFQTEKQSTHAIRFKADNKVFSVFVYQHQDKIWCSFLGKTFVVKTQIKKSKQLSAEESQSLVLSPMPAKVFKICVADGDSVKKDQELVILEAMKMEYQLLAPKDGVIKLLGISQGDQVELGQEIARIEI